METMGAVEGVEEVVQEAVDEAADKARVKEVGSVAKAATWAGLLVACLGALAVPAANRAAVPTAVVVSTAASAARAVDRMVEKMAAAKGVGGREEAAAMAAGAEAEGKLSSAHSPCSQCQYRLSHHTERREVKVPIIRFWQDAHSAQSGPGFDSKQLLQSEYEADAPPSSQVPSAL